MISSEGEREVLESARQSLWHPCKTDPEIWCFTGWRFDPDRSSDIQKVWSS